jgi:hypothetical protein
MTPDTARLAKFFLGQTEKLFCVKCLASELGSSLKDVRGVLVTLSAEIRLNRGAGQCAKCHGWNVVYGLVPPEADTRSPEERLAEFLRERAGAAFCNTCLCRELRIPFHVVRKAADRLRMARTARLYGGRCAICARQRLVIGPDAAGERNANRLRSV